MLERAETGGKMLMSRCRCLSWKQRERSRDQVLRVLPTRLRKRVRSSVPIRPGLTLHGSTSTDAHAVCPAIVWSSLTRTSLHELVFLSTSLAAVAIVRVKASRL